MLKQILLSLSLGVGIITTAYAEQYPRVVGDDARVQVFDYNPSTVYAVKAKLGYSSLIQLEDGEEIDDSSGLGMGDAKSWSLAVKGRNIFFKPIAENADTNIVLVTNKRTYAFQLKTAQPSEASTYIARFNYPEESAPAKPQTPVMPAFLQVINTDENNHEILIDADINTGYVYRGAAELKPTNVWDNGRFTYVKFAHAGDMPTIYRVLPDNTETLVNSHIEGDTLVLQEIGYRYYLRLGKAVGELGNQQNKLPKFNTTGTSSKDFIRVEQ